MDEAFGRSAYPALKAGEVSLQSRPCLGSSGRIDSKQVKPGLSDRGPPNLCSFLESALLLEVRSMLRRRTNKQRKFVCTSAKLRYRLPRWQQILRNHKPGTFLRIMTRSSAGRPSREGGDDGFLSGFENCGSGRRRRLTVV